MQLLNLHQIMHTSRGGAGGKSIIPVHVACSHIISVLTSKPGDWNSIYPSKWGWSKSMFLSMLHVPLSKPGDWNPVGLEQIHVPAHVSCSQEPGGWNSQSRWAGASRPGASRPTPNSPDTLGGKEHAAWVGTWTGTCMHHRKRASSPE